MIPNDKQRGSFIFSSHLISQTIPSLRWLLRGSLSSPVCSAQKPVKRCQQGCRRKSQAGDPCSGAGLPGCLLLATWCCFCDKKSHSGRLGTEAALDRETFPECSHALCSSWAMQRCLSMPTFGAHICLTIVA